MTPDEKLAHSLKLRFGLAPLEPDARQLQLIKAAIAAISRTGRIATDNDWRDAVAAACPNIGRYVYRGLDNSDLNTLLALAIQAAGGRG